MTIIQKQPNPSGAYPPIQSWSGAVPPDTHYEIICDTSEFFNGYVIPTIENDKVISYECNTKAWEAWKASLAEPPIDDITALQLAVAELAEAQAADQTANELALAELAEIMAGG